MVERLRVLDYVGFFVLGNALVLGDEGRARQQTTDSGNAVACVDAQAHAWFSDETQTGC